MRKSVVLFILIAGWFLVQAAGSWAQEPPLEVEQRLRFLQPIERWAATDEDPLRPNSAVIPIPINEPLLESYDLAERHAREENWVDVIEIYQSLLENEQDNLMVTDHGTRYRSIRRDVLNRLLTLGEVPLQKYRERFDPVAEGLVDRAVAARDRTALLKAVTRYAATSHGARALKLLADLQLEAGEVGRALAHWEELGSLHPDALDPITRAKMAAAYAILNHPLSARRQINLLQAVAPKGNGLRNREQTVANLLALLENHPAERGLVDWPMIGGDATHARVAAGTEPVSGLLWHADITETGYRGFSDEQHRVLQNITSPGFSPIEVTGTETNVYFTTGSTVFGYPIWGEGLPAWRWRLKDNAVGPSQMLKNQLSVTLDGDRLYALLQGTKSTIPSLVCLDRRTRVEGQRRLWIAGRRSVPGLAPEEAALFIDLQLHGAPVVQDDSLYIMGRRSLHAGVGHIVPPPRQLDGWFPHETAGYEYRLVCLNRSDGAIRWIRPISRERPHRYGGAGGRFGTRAPSTVGLARGMVFCVTNAGTLAAIDAKTGTIRWITKYPRHEMSTRGVNGLARAGLTPLRVFRGVNDDRYGWRDTPPILMGGRLYAAPRDGDDLLCLDPNNGKILWRFARAKGMAGKINKNTRQATPFTPEQLQQRAAKGKVRWVPQILGVDPNRHLIFMGGGWKLWVLDASREGALAAPPQTIPDGGMVGRGVIAGDRLRIPTAHAIYEVAIDDLLAQPRIDSYQWRERVSWEQMVPDRPELAKRLPGNLTVIGRNVIVSSAEGVSVLYNAQQRYAQLTHLLAQALPTDRARLLLVRGELQVRTGELQKALPDFANAFDVANRLAAEQEQFDWNTNPPLWPEPTIHAVTREVGAHTLVAARTREAMAHANLVLAAQAVGAPLPKLGPHPSDAPVRDADRASVRRAEQWFEKAGQNAVMATTFIDAVIGQVRCRQALGDWAGAVDRYQLLLARCPKAQFDFSPFDANDSLLRVRSAGRLARSKISAIVAQHGKATYRRHEMAAAKLNNPQAVLARYPNSQAAGAARVQLAEVAWKNGELAEALRLWRSYLRRRPNGTLAGDVLARIARLYEQSGRWVDARDTLVALQNRNDVDRLTVTLDGHTDDALDYVTERLDAAVYSDVLLAEHKTIGTLTQMAWRHPLHAPRSAVSVVHNTDPAAGDTAQLFLLVLETQPSAAKLFAYDKTTGRQLMSHLFNSVGGLGSVVQTGDTVFFSDGQSVARLNALTGAREWKRALPVPPPPKSMLMTGSDGQFRATFPNTPVTTRINWRPVELVTNGETVCALIRSGPHAVAVGLDPTTGAMLWWADLGAPAAHFTSPQMTAGLLIVPVRDTDRADANSRLMVLDSGTGDWQFTTRSARYQSTLRERIDLPDFAYTTDSGRLYLQAGNAVTCYRLSDGTVVWERPLLYNVQHHVTHYSAAPLTLGTMAQNKTFVVAIAQGKKLFVIDKQTGKVVWHRNAGHGTDSGNEVLLACRLVGDTAWLVSTRNEGVDLTEMVAKRGHGGRRDLWVHAINLENGRVTGSAVREGVEQLYQVTATVDGLITVSRESGIRKPGSRSNIWMLKGPEAKGWTLPADPRIKNIMEKATGVSVAHGRLIVASAAGAAAYSK